MLKKSVAAAALTALLSAQMAQALPARPPQYVAMAFDGSLSLDAWSRTREFQQQMVAKGKPLHFTYFMNGPYYLANANKSNYNFPGHRGGAGRNTHTSAIGWGGDVSSIPLRMQTTNGAFMDGNELGSHANAHFDAGEDQWTRDQWEQEFSEWDKIMFNVYGLNGVSPTQALLDRISSDSRFKGRSSTPGYAFIKSDSVGFRAPMLGVTPGLWPTLVAHGYQYDTSRTDAMTYWPQKMGPSGKAMDFQNIDHDSDTWKNGFWNFPLADVTIAGTGKRTLSMDYNFYVAQTGGDGHPDQPQNADLYQKQMFETYMRYFKGNYTGNRAPVHIGHHFALWNGGAYWAAMKQFAEAVCGLPEVKCVTYTELKNKMEEYKATGVLASYRQGSFDRSSAPSIQSLKSDELPENYEDLKLDVNVGADGNPIATLSGKDQERLKQEGATIEYEVGGIPMGESSIQRIDSVDVSSLPLASAPAAGFSTKSLADSQKIRVVVKVGGREIVSSTRAIGQTQNGIVLSDHTVEEQALKGDLEGAHKHDNDSRRVK